MQEWEYMVWRLGSPTDNDGGTVKLLAGKELSDWESGPHLPQALNTAGADGWELINVSYFESGLRDPVFILKRPLVRQRHLDAGYDRLSFRGKGGQWMGSRRAS